MTTDMLRQTLAEARRLELLTGSFEWSLRDRCRRLHRAIQLPRRDVGSAVVNFVTHYIEETALVIETVEEQAGETGLLNAAEPAVGAALAFFCATPAPDQAKPKLRQLLEQAYLAQRLLEEVDDLIALWCGTRLINFDTTHINLIVHQLIDEPLANQLDLVANRLATEYLPLIRETRLPIRGDQDAHRKLPTLHGLQPKDDKNHAIRLNIGTA